MCVYSGEYATDLMIDEIAMFGDQIQDKLFSKKISHDPYITGTHDLSRTTQLSTKVCCRN